MSAFMTSVLGGVVQVLFPMILKGLDIWMQTKNKNKAMTESYYSFLQQIDAAGAAKVSQYLASEDALAEKQDELRKQLEELKKEVIEEEQRNPAVSPAMRRNFTKR